VREKRREEAEGTEQVGLGRVGIAPEASRCRTGEREKNGRGDMEGTCLPGPVRAPAPALALQKCVGLATAS